MGQVVGAREAKILLVYSAPYRCQEERELGFRRVLRSEHQHLAVEERLNSNDDSEYVHRNVMRYIADRGPPAGIYNVAGGNAGVGRALTDSDLVDKVVFVGHELNANSRVLLESGVMRFAIGHDVVDEVAMAAEHAVALLGKRAVPPPAHTRVRVYTKYNCD
jgi:LacI family transcriptional regulator